MKRLLQLHGVLMALHRLHPAARLLTFLPLWAIVAVARHALWWLALRQNIERVLRGR